MVSSISRNSWTTWLTEAIRERFGPGIRSVLPFWLLGAGVIAVVWLIGTFHHVKFAHLTRDPTAVMNAPFYTGILSVAGGLFWAATVGVCLFSAWVVRDSDVTPSTSFFFWTSGFIAWLMCDDVFQFHEDVFPRILHIKEIYVEAAYPVFALLWICFFWRVILKTNWLMVGTAFSFLAFSELLDVILHQVPKYETNISFLIEDGAKLLGIVTWLGYVVNTGSRAIDDAIRSRRS